MSAVPPCYFCAARQCAFEVGSMPICDQCATRLEIDRPKADYPLTSEYHDAKSGGWWPTASAKEDE